MTVLVPVACPYCLNEKLVVKFGHTQQGKQRYKCRNNECDRSTFIIDYEKKGFLPWVKAKIIDMTMNGSGVRDIARVLGISKDKVMREIKKKKNACSR